MLLSENELVLKAGREGHKSIPENTIADPSDHPPIEAASVALTVGLSPSSLLRALQLSSLLLRRAKMVETVKQGKQTEKFKLRLSSQQDSKGMNLLAPETWWESATLRTVFEYILSTK